MNLDRNLAIEDLFDISQLRTGTIADVLDRFDIWGVLSSDVIPLNCGNDQGPTVGYAYTVKWKPTPEANGNWTSKPLIWNQIKELLSQNFESIKDKIYVGGVEDGLQRSLALAGGFSATHFQRAGMRGMILGGALRDAHVVKEITMPIWGTNFTPADAKGRYEIAEIGTSCTIADLTIYTGDLIVADASGVTVIPREKIFEVLALATEINDKSHVFQSLKCN